MIQYAWNNQTIRASGMEQKAPLPRPRLGMRMQTIRASGIEQKAAKERLFIKRLAKQSARVAWSKKYLDGGATVP